MEKEFFREYEATLLLSPTLSEQEARDFVEHFKQEKLEGAEVIFEDFWGRQRLAYPIKKQEFAYYVVLNFIGDPQKIAPLDEEIRLDQNILRHLLLAVDKYALKMTLDEIREWNSANLPQQEKSLRRQEKRAPLRAGKKPTARPEQKGDEKQSENKEAVDKSKLDKKLNAILGDNELDF